MDWPKDCHNEWCKSDREGKMSYNNHLYVGSKKKKTIQMNLPTKQKEIHRLREWTYGCLYTLLHLKWITNYIQWITYCTACGTLVMWQPGWERSLGENGCMCMHSWVPLLSTWSYHNIVNWLYYNIKQKVKNCFAIDCFKNLKH